MNRLLAFILLFSCSGFTQSKSAPANQAPPFELDTFYMAIMHRTAGFDPDKFHQVLTSEYAYWQAIADRNDLILAGPADNGKDDLAAVTIYRSPTPEAATKIAQGDPEVSAHLWTVEVHPWMTKKGVLKPIHSCDFTTTYYLGLLVRGPKFSPEDSPERQKIQEGHMANIQRLADLGKLVAAGPFAEDLDLRGIFVFRTENMEEALQLTNTDPAVQAGRLAIRLYAWKLPSEAFSKN
jgi:uncharacterized protein YciI